MMVKPHLMPVLVQNYIAINKPYFLVFFSKVCGWVGDIYPYIVINHEYGLFWSLVFQVFSPSIHIYDL
jgi:hypothetical protein